MKFRTAVLLSIATILLFHCAEAARFPRGGPPPSGLTSWNFVRFDGGGFVTGLDVATDGVKFVRTDTAGAWISAAGPAQWTLANTHSSMPSPYNGFGKFSGVYSVAIAHGNSQRLYMYVCDGNLTTAGCGIMRSSDRGASWTHTCTAINFAANPNDNGSVETRLNGPYMRVDPNNADVALFGTPSNGVYYTADGGTTCTQISTAQLPVATTPAGGTQGQGNLIGFDTGSSGCTTPVGGKSQCIFASSYGHGLYRSTDGGTTFTIQNSANMPTTFTQMYVDQGGVVWMTDSTNGGGGAGSGKTWRYTIANTTWQNQTALMSTSGTCPATANTGVTVDPTNPAHAFTSDFHGCLWVTTTATSATPTWLGPTAFTEVATTNPWMAAAADTSLGIATLNFDPSQTNLLLATGGTGVWQTNPPTTNVSVTWNGNATAGLQNIDATTAISVPSGPMILQAQDRSTWLISDPSTPQANYFPNYTASNHIDPGWGWGSYLHSSPSTIFSLSDQNGVQWSTSGTVGSFTPITAYPVQAQSLGRGQIAAYTNSNAAWAMSDSNGVSCLTAGTLTGTPTWSNCTFTNGATMAGGGWNDAHFYNRNILTLDDVDVSTYYLYNSGSGTNTGGVYKSTNGTSFSPVSTQIFDGIAVSSSNFSMFAVPGKSGEIYAAAMADPNGTLPNTLLHLYKSVDHGANWTAVPNIQSLFGFALGAAKPGGSGYPAVFAVGWASTDGGLTYNYGTWRADDGNLATPTWTLIGDGYPAGNFDYIKFVAADRNTYGTVYVGFLGSGFAYGQIH